MLRSFQITVTKKTVAMCLNRTGSEQLIRVICEDITWVVGSFNHKSESVAWVNLEKCGLCVTQTEI